MECHNCKRSLPWALHGRDGCHYHSGILQPTPRTACDDQMDLEPSFDDYLKSRRWTCCNQVGGNPGCHWGRHQLRQQHATVAAGPRVGGADFPSARNHLKRRNTDDSDSDSGMEDRFDGRGSSSVFGAVFRTVSGLGAKLRRIDRGSLDASIDPSRQNPSFFSAA
ncbi:hypothetical protein F5X68DRAFT_29302 [Plectosphaerella plurivora]|uniref:Uncharacterized protein n=1 Tax=Plectosphaerella plurivora TaxID=936078 RepID=A0A9P8VL82_9PEZI|nr:hypothetical protein F5X68DRAFT_29302 [Plectosphaerella plurivora]